VSSVVEVGDLPSLVAITETALADMFGANLRELELVALMIDGVHFANHLCIVALGIGADGTKHPLGLAEGTPRPPPSSAISWTTCTTGGTGTHPGRLRKRHRPTAKPRFRFASSASFM
jgi:hypothetical protein